MSMIASDKGGSNIPKLENGVYTAISSVIIDLGIQTSEKFGNAQRKFILMWIILHEEVEINGEKFPRTMAKEYTFSLSEKSNLRKDLQAWRGKPFTQEELKGFDILNILNKPCQLQIILEERNGNQYNNIAGIMSLPKGTKVDVLDNTFHFDIEDMDTWINWAFIPTWIQEKIKKAENYVTSELNKYVEEYEKDNRKKNDSDNKDNNLENTSDDLPF